MNSNNIQNTIKCHIIDLSKVQRFRLQVPQYLTESIFAHLQFVNRGFPLNIADYEVDICYRTIVGKEFIFKAIKINSTKGIVALKSDYDLTKNFGEVEAEIHIKKTDKIIYSCQFFVDVKKSIIQDGSKPEIDIFKLQKDFDEMELDMGSFEMIEVQGATNIIDAINKVEKKTDSSLNIKHEIKKSEMDTILSIFDI